MEFREQRKLIESINSLEPIFKRANALCEENHIPVTASLSRNIEGWNVKMLQCQLDELKEFINDTIRIFNTSELENLDIDYDIWLSKQESLYTSNLTHPADGNEMNNEAETR